MALQALWDVSNQFNNKNGSILTNGQIYVYYQGRSALATTFHDEDGTVVNSNPIRLDNNGRATCYASSMYAYTVVVCDFYGKELFSYDITLHDAVDTAEHVFVIGTDGSVLVDETTLPNGVQYDLSVNTDIIATKEYVDDEVDNLQSQIDNKKDKQEVYSSAGSTKKTITNVEQNENGEMTVTYEDIDIKGVQYTTARFPFNSNKIVKIAEIPLYPTFEYQGSGRANLQLLITDSYGSEAIFSLGIIQAGTSSHMVQPKGVFKYIHPGNGRTTYPIKMMHVRPDNASAPMTNATLYLYAEFDESYNQQADWSFKAVINEGSTSTTSKVENAWTFRNTVIAPQADFDQARSWWYLAPSSMETIPNVEITSEDNSIQVTESTDVQTNTKTFDLSVNVDDALEYGQFRATNVTGLAQLAKIKGNLDLSNYLIKLKKGNSYHFTVRGNYVADNAANTATTISYIEYSSFNTINVNVDNTITEPQYFEISYDIYNYSQSGDYNVSFSAISGGKVTELWVEVHNLNGVTINGSGVSNIVIAREYNGVLDDTYDGLKIRQADNGNEIVALRKNNNWFSFGQLAPLSAGADKILITDSNGTVHWGIVGNGLEIDNDTLEVKIDSEVGDVVETVNKLSKDIDRKLTTNFDMAQIIAKYDFADSSVTGLSNGATMLYQAFTIPINNNIRIISAEEEEPTLLGIYATQNYTGKIMLAIYQYDFESGYTQYIGDTGPVTVNASRNEYPLRHINPDITELSSGNVYYAALYLPSSHNNGLNLVGCPGYSQTFNSIPRLTMGTQNILYNNTEIDMTDATTGRLDYNDGNNNYYIGPWLDGYNESNYACPRFFLQLRNGTFNEPIIVNVPFIDIGAYTLDYQNGIPDVFGDTSALSQSSDAYPIFQTVVPLQDVDITEITLIDGNATHNAVYWNTGAFGIHSSDFSTRIGNGVTATVTDDTIATSVYSHKYTLSAPIHLTANTTYRFPSGYVTNLVSRVRQYATPTVEKTLFLMDNIYYVSEYSNYVRANAVQGTFLKVKDSNNNEYVI